VSMTVRTAAASGTTYPLDRELIFVTGKGGVGRTTVAIALAMLAARAGRRTILCEVSGQTRATRLLHGTPGAPGAEVGLRDGLWATTVDPPAALEEWAASVVGSRRVAHALTASSAFGAFLAAAPGARELVTIAKAWELGRAERWSRAARRYDLVVVDGPATGHGVGLLRTPRTFAGIARVGPIATQSRRVAELLEDPARAAIVAVAQPAEMPVAEALDLEERVRTALGREVDAVVLNAVRPRRFSADEVARIVAAGDRVPSGARAAVRRSHGVVGEEQRQLRRLRREAAAPVVTLPFVASPALGPEEVEQLSEVLERRLAG
jgi:anion-transporting  ArsA/GET3 family ATPase